MSSAESREREEQRVSEDYDSVCCQFKENLVERRAVLCLLDVCEPFMFSVYYKNERRKKNEEKRK